VELCFLIPALPLAGFLILTLFGARLGRRAAATIGVGSVAASAVLALIVAVQFLAAYFGSEGAGGGVATPFVQPLWPWMSVGTFEASISLRIDALSLVMMVVVTFIGALIHLYSIEYMADDPGFSRFLAYLNLFVAMMLLLVLGDNLLVLYFGWEGVGLASYLLIGFWSENPENGRCARKAFITTRVGDVFLGLGIFLLFHSFGTLDIETIKSTAVGQWTAGSSLPVVAALFLLLGAIGKSAQLPLHVWLPDAMAGPTPVSALLHSATMVTAGVYLIARMAPIFTLAPQIMTLTAAVGAVTLVVAGFSALTQTDIKRVLAYSSISQIGYMFLALGVGSFTGAIFHFFTHAFFKALLFLAAGAVIHALHHEQDLRRMGGLRKQLPVVFWTFCAGAASLSALPLVTAGFYSKDAILWHAWLSPAGGKWLWMAGVLGAFLTALYTFRMVFLAFFGVSKTEVHHHPGRLMQAPLLVLAVLSLTVGFLETPHSLGHVTLFSRFASAAFPAVAEAHEGGVTEIILQIAATGLTLLGVLTAMYCFLGDRNRGTAFASSGIGARLHRFWQSGWGFDRLYEVAFVRPLDWLSRVMARDVVDPFYSAVAVGHEIIHEIAALSQSGALRWYAAWMLAGVALTVAMVVFL
jgi:NADH-quinone oxidoreductase subunit L